MAAKPSLHSRKLYRSAKFEPSKNELNGPSALVRDGWKPKTLTPGMNVSVTIHPLRDGTNGGQFLKVKLPDGSEMGRGGVQPVQGATPPAP